MGENKAGRYSRYGNHSSDITFDQEHRCIAIQRSEWSVVSIYHQVFTDPFPVSSGVACFVVDGVRAMTGALTADKNVHVDCLLCGASVLSTQIRTHTGRHIIHHLYRMNESDLKREVCDNHIQFTPYVNDMFQVGDHACGFCGGDECTTTMATSNGSRVIESNCAYQHPFRYGAAIGEKSSCTNVPIHCPHCDSGSHKLTIWKYNAFGHIRAAHSDLIPYGLDKAFRLNIQITPREEKKMDLIPESIEEFHSTERSLLLGNTELSSLKSEVEADTSLLKKSKKRGRHALDTPATPAKKKKDEAGTTDILIFPAKRKAAPNDLDPPSPPSKRTKHI